MKYFVVSRLLQLKWYCCDRLITIKGVASLSPVRIVLLESIPEGLEFNSSTTQPSIFQAWLNLMSEARSSVDIASFYWTLTNNDTGTHEPTASEVSWSIERLKISSV